MESMSMGVSFPSNTRTDGIRSRAARSLGVNRCWSSGPAEAMSRGYRRMIGLSPGGPPWQCAAALVVLTVRTDEHRPVAGGCRNHEEGDVATLLSVNVGMPGDVAWHGKTVHTGIWKSPVNGPAMVRR